MDKDEARSVRAEKLAELRDSSYEDLVKRLIPVDAETSEVVGPSGARYQLEVLGHWDGKPDSDLRVVVAIDDGGWRGLVPSAEDFIVRPDGTFVDE